MNKTSSNKKNSNHMPFRTSGRPLFSYLSGEETVEVFDLEQFRRESGIAPTDIEGIVAELMIAGQTEHEGMIFELHDGQGLAQYL